MATIIFVSREQANLALKEVAATPDIVGGVGPVWVWFDPDGDTNTITYATAPDGRVAIAHHWTDVDVDWLTAYLTGPNAPAAWSGIQILDTLPDDWSSPHDA